METTTNATNTQPGEALDADDALDLVTKPGGAGASDVAAGQTSSGQGVRAGARPGVVQLAIREKAALYASYMPFIEGGGLFVPTTRTVNIGDELYLILTLMDDPNKLPVTGKVVWITPAGTPGRQQGLGVQFTKDDAGTQARNRIETLLGGVLKTNRPTHTI